MHIKQLLITSRNTRSDNLNSKPLYLLLLCFFTCFLQLNGQSLSKPKASSFSESDHYISQLYASAFGKTTFFYTGAEYIRPLTATKGHPFLDTAELQKGNVFFDGILYQDVLIALDLVSGVLITNGYQNIRMQLPSQKIGYFTINNRLFIPVAGNSANPNFYEVLYKDSLTVLAHYKKIAAKAFRPEDPYVFKTYTDYYIQKDTRLTGITSVKTLLEALADKKEEVRKYIQKNKLDLKKIPEKTIVQSIIYYQTLTR